MKDVAQFTRVGPDQRQKVWWGGGLQYSVSPQKIRRQFPKIEKSISDKLRGDRKFKMIENNELG